MKLSKTVKIAFISLGIIITISIIGINTIIKNNREEANKLEQERLEEKINNLEEQLKGENPKNDKEKDTKVDEDKAKEEVEDLQPQLSAMDMYNKAVEDYSHLVVNRFYNYYMAIYGAIENNYNNYSDKDMYEVADKFLNLLYGDIKDHGALSDELLQEQREWLDYKLNNFDENDYSGLYKYTMDRCEELIEGYN